jgi:molybdopterin synthase catalytic subunit
VRVQVLYFAMLRERVGYEREELELADGADVRAARAAIAARHAEIAPLLHRVATAVNRTMAADSQALADGDEIALIPPVAGGAGSWTVLS